MILFNLINSSRSKPIVENNDRRSKPEYVNRLNSLGDRSISKYNSASIERKSQFQNSDEEIYGTSLNLSEGVTCVYHLNHF